MTKKLIKVMDTSLEMVSSLYTELEFSLTTFYLR